jgi:WD40 repeat protein
VESDLLRANASSYRRDSPLSLSRFSGFFSSSRRVHFRTCLSSLWTASRCNLRRRSESVVQFLADSAKLVTVDGEKVRLWTIGLSHVVSTEVGQQSSSSGIRCAALSRDGRWVATASENEVLLWQGNGTGLVREMTDHRSRVTSLRFDVSSSQLLTASLDKTARVWSVTDERRPIVLEGHESGLNDASFTPDESRIVTASSDGSVRVWRYRWSDIVEYLMTATEAELTMEQRSRLLGETVRRER